jgi:hypothetical protein
VQHVIERDDLLRRMAAVARLGAQAIHPAHHALVELRVRAHGVEHLGAVLEQAGQDLVDVADRERVIGAVVARRAFGPGAPCRPRFRAPDRGRARTGCIRPADGPAPAPRRIRARLKPVR